MNDRADIVHEAFRARLARGDLPAASGGRRAEGGDRHLLAEIFRSQVTSRHLDRHARKLQARGEAFYTIGSSGHEGTAAVAAAFRPSDPAFLHYRDGAFLVQRAQQVPGQTPVWDMLLSFAASAEDPISGGRHKVLGSKALNVPPQTSTIASHLPKAVGAAFSIPLANTLKPEHRAYARDAVALASFGDASVNHSTAQGAFNTAGWTAYRGTPLPLVLVCEDNGIGISTKTPGGWIEASISGRPGLHYLTCNGLDIADTLAAAREAEAIARRRKRPVFLHMTCVRLYGHAGSDMQTAYMTQKEVEAAEANDPLLHSAGLLIETAGLSKEDCLSIYDEVDAQVAAVAEEAIQRPKLGGAAEVMASLIPPRRSAAPSNGPSKAEREAAFGIDARNLDTPQHMARLVNWALTDLMLEHREIVLAGEDIGPKGGVYNVTAKLHERFGPARVINTLLDEQTILGLSIGLAHNGLLPIPEIQFLAYLHNAEDQLRGEAATLSFFSNGQFTNPMVIRIAGLGYQRGFGGHFHNDNSVAVIRDIPGVVLACPSNGRDAVLMLRESLRLAREEQRVVVFLEPIARYMTRDLMAEKDGLWTFVYPPPGDPAIGLGEVGVHGEGRDLGIVTYGNGVFLSRQAQHDLAAKGVAARVVDLRWLAPLPEAALLEATADCDAVLIVDECRRTGSQSEALMTLFAEARPELRVARETAEDSFIPLGRAATATLPSRESIAEAAVALLGRSGKRRKLS